MILSPVERATLWAAAERVLDGAAGSVDREPVVAECERLLDSRPASTRLAFKAFLYFLRWAPSFGFGGRLEALNEAERDRFLAALQCCPIRPIRVGFWGLRTMALISHYGRPGVGRAVGYQPGS